MCDTRRDVAVDQISFGATVLSVPSGSTDNEESLRTQAHGLSHHSNVSDRVASRTKHTYIHTYIHDLWE